MSTISSVSCMSSLSSYSSVKNTQKSDTSSLVDKLFSKLDTKQQGYVDKSELQTALTSVSGTTSSATSGTSTDADDLFAKMDADGDGKVTKQEMGTTLQSMLDQMDNLAAQMRVQGGASGTSGTTQDDKGFTKDELTQMAQDVSGTDSKRSEFMSKLADNFDKADTDGNGKITRDEAMSYAKSTGENMGGPSGPSGSAPPPPPPGGAPAGATGSSTTADSGTTDSSTASTDPADTNGDGKVSATEALNYLLTQLSTSDSSSTSDSDSTGKDSGFSDKIARQIMQLVQAYGSSTSAANDEGSSISSNLSVSA